MILSTKHQLKRATLRCLATIPNASKTPQATSPTHTTNTENTKTLQRNVNTQEHKQRSFLNIQKPSTHNYNNILQQINSAVPTENNIVSKIDELKTQEKLLNLPSASTHTNSHRQVHSARNIQYQSYIKMQANNNKLLNLQSIKLAVNIVKNAPQKRSASSMYSKARILHISKDYQQVFCNSTYVISSRCLSTLPRAKKLPLVDTLKPIFLPDSALRLHNHVDELHQKLGPIFAESVGPIDCVFLSCPQAMRHVFAHEGKHPRHILPEAWTTYNEKHGNSRGLFFMDGSEWLDYRKVMNRILLKIDQSIVEASCQPIAKSLHLELVSKTETHGHAVHLESMLFTWSLATLVSILIGHQADSKWIAELHREIKALGEANQNVFVTTSKLSLISSKLACKYNIPSWKRFEKAVSTSLQGSKILVEKLLKNYVHRSGVLHQMREENLQDGDIVRLITDLVLAAGDTTSYSMEWLLYCLGKHQTWQDILRSNATDITYYKNVIRETLRLYPIAPFLTRILPEEVEVLGHKIPADSLIVMSIYTSGRSEENFANALDFNPNRWLRNEEMGGLKHMQMASLPFAMGARSCIGRRIAEAQMKTTLAQILPTHKIVLQNKRDIEMVLKMVGVPSEPVKLAFVPLQ